MIKQSFPLRVLCITFIVLALPLLINSLYFFQRSYEESIQRARIELREIANSRAFALYNIQPAEPKILKEVDYILHQQGKTQNTKELNHLLEALAGVTKTLDFFLVKENTPSEFEVIASSIPSSVNTTIISYKRFPSVLAGYEKGFFFFELSEQSGTYIPYIYMGKPFALTQQDSKDTTQHSLLLVRHEAKRALSQVVNTESIKHNQRVPSAKFAVMQADGIAIAATDPTFLGNYFVPFSEKRRREMEEQDIGAVIGNIKLAPESLPVLKNTHNSDFFQFIYKGQLQVAYQASVPLMNASLIIYLPKSAFFAREIGLFFLIYLLYGGIFIFGGIFTYWLTLWLSRPLKQLSYVMGEVQRGNLAVRFVSQPFGYEINFLGTSFNLTLDSLLENMQRLEDERVQRETYEREIKIGHTVQRNLFPAPLKPIDEVEIGAYYHFAQEVGGDFYDYAIAEREGGEKDITLVIADASGKGVSSCLYALSARSFIRSAATLHNKVGQILATANNAFFQDTGETGMFVSVLMGLYSTTTSLFTYYSCGHVPALVKRKTGEVLLLEHTGMAMGLMEVEELKENSVQLESGDLVLFYTSGLIDVSNDRGVIFSQRRLVKALEKHEWRTPKEMIDGIIALATNFAKGGVLEEEITLLVMKIR